MMTLYRDNAASVQPPPAVGGNILIKDIMLNVYSFAIVRLSVFARQNPDMSRSRARGRPGMTHECRLLLKIVTSRGGKCQFVRRGQLVFAAHTSDYISLHDHHPARPSSLSWSTERLIATLPARSSPQPTAVEPCYLDAILRS